MKTKQHEPKRTTVSISISIPVEIEAPLNAAAVRMGMTRSQFFTWLARHHLYLERGLLPGIEVPPIPSTPPRITRSSQN